MRESSWCRNMMKAGSCSLIVGRLMWLNYFKTAKRQSVQWHRPMHDFVYEEDFCPFIEEPTVSEIRRYHPGNYFSISCVAIAVENLTHRSRRKNCDASTYQSNNFGVNRKRFKPSTPRGRFTWPWPWPRPWPHRTHRCLNSSGWLSRPYNEPFWIGLAL